VASYLLKFRTSERHAVLKGYNANLKEKGGKTKEDRLDFYKVLKRFGKR